MSWVGGEKTLREEVSRHFLLYCKRYAEVFGGGSWVLFHNRGTSCYFREVDTLNPGDEITLTTKLGTKTYQVTSVERVRETETSGMADTENDQITLYTCAQNRSVYRWKLAAV